MTAAANAAMTVAPKLLTRPWTIRMPRFITDCWTHVRIEKPAISFTQLHFTRVLLKMALSWGYCLTA